LKRPGTIKHWLSNLEKFEVHPVMIAKWKFEFLERMSIVFKNPNEEASEDNVDNRERCAQQRSIHEG
jgi:hypothetical protein